MQSQMVLLVDHHPHRSLHQQCRPRPRPCFAVEPRELLAHQMALVQELALSPLELVEPERHSPAQPVARCPRFGHAREHGRAVGVAGTLAENVALQVAREPDAGR